MIMYDFLYWYLLLKTIGIDAWFSKVCE